MYEKLNICPTLNLNVRLYRQSKKKKLGTSIKKSMIFIALKSVEFINSVEFL